MTSQDAKKISKWRLPLNKVEKESNYLYKSHSKHLLIYFKNVPGGLLKMNMLFSA